MRNKHKVYLGILGLIIIGVFIYFMNQLSLSMDLWRSEAGQLKKQVAEQTNALNRATAELELSESLLRQIMPMVPLASIKEVIELPGMRIHMYHPTRVECGNTPWVTSSGVRAKPMRTAAISRKLKKKLGVEFGDLLIVDGHVWIIESNMARRETAHFDLMYPVGTPQFRLLNTTTHIIRVASAVK